MVRPLVVPNPKITMVFDMEPQGWSESHIYTAIVPLTDAGLYAAMKALVKARTYCLDGRYATLVGARASLDNVNRDVLDLMTADIPIAVASGYAGGPPPNLTTSNWAYSGPQAAWPVKLRTTNPTTNPLEYITIGSIPIGQVGRSANQAPANNVLFFINKYIAELTNGNWGALGRNWDVPGTAFLVTNIAYTAPAGISPAILAFTVALPAPVPSVFPTGAYFRLEGATYTAAQSKLRLNGTYTVMDYNSTTGVVRCQIPRLKAGPLFDALGAITPATASVFPYLAGNVRPITHRKRGRPTDAARGRR